MKKNFKKNKLVWSRGEPHLHCLYILHTCRIKSEISTYDYWEDCRKDFEQLQCLKPERGHWLH